VWVVTTCPLPPNLAARFVGDPIDAVTGAFFDDVQDFIVASDELPIAWRRTYSTERIAEDRGLGRGHSHAFDHRLKLDLDGIRYTSPLGETVHFPSFHAGINRVARSGHVLTRDGARLSLERPSGPELVFDLLPSAHARLAEVRSVGRSIFVGYDFTGRLASLGDTDGNVVSFTWGEKHILSARVLAPGATAHVELVRYRYEGGLLVEVQDAYKHSLLYAYDDAGRLVRRTDRRGYSFSFEYDADGRCIHSAGDDGMLEVRLEYFPFELRTRVTKSDGGVWEYFYDSAKTLTKIVDPEGIERSFVPRPEDGQIALEIDGAGNEIVSLYDNDGRRIGRRDALGRPIAPRRGHRVPSTPAEYELGKLATLPEELPTRELLQYSLPPAIAGSLVLGSGAGEGRVREVRDVQGLLIREERDGLTRRYAYDENGNLRWDIDFDGAKTEYAYASYNHRVEETDPNGFVTRFEYTKEDVLGGVVDAQHTRTVFPRDSRNNVKGVSRANAWKEGYRRDGAGRLVEKTNANGTCLYQITRGPQGEVLERAFASGGFERFEYDRLLRVVAAETPAGKQTFAYDYDGDRTADLRDGKGVRRRFVDRALVAHRVLDRFVTRYRYLETPHAREVVITDPTGREHRVRDHKSGVFTRELASGRRETVQYHPDGHCLARLVQGGSDEASVWSRRYEYSGEGYLVAGHDSARGTTRFEHDAAQRLSAMLPPTGPSRVFEHDAAGNLLANGGGYALYHPGNVLAEANGRRFEHDLRQAVCSEAWQGGFRRFHRDERDQLVRVESYRTAPADDAAAATRWEPLPDWTARYDALNRRVDKTVAGQTTVFYWDTDRLAAEVQPSGALRVYVYADALAMTPLLFVDYASVEAAPESGAVYAVLADHLGCPERVEDMAGQTVWSAVVAPYGALQVMTGSGFHQPLRWPGHYYDAELGLQYNRFRTYSPELGRYLEPDPLGRAGGLENVYAYTHNPLFRVDTHGLNECAEATAARKKAAAENEEEGKPEEGVKQLDVDSYGELTGRSKPYDELQNDHIPSFAACVAAAEQHLGRELEPQERTALKNSLTAITVPDDVHRGDSRTYGGRNSKSQIAGDSADLAAAAQKDMAASRQALIDSGNSPEAVDAALGKVDQRNRDNGVYDPETLSKMATQ
jgi:RHS repeat-associated protein